MDSVVRFRYPRLLEISAVLTLLIPKLGFVNGSKSNNVMYSAMRYALRGFYSLSLGCWSYTIATGICPVADLCMRESDKSPP
eukprot:821986-Prorocentrum_minimum.AAC.5